MRDSLMLAATSPVDECNTHSRWLFTVTEDMADLAGEDFISGFSQGVLQDMRIWKNKIHRASPVLCDADKELAFFRKWVRQFYPPRRGGAKERADERSQWCWGARMSRLLVISSDCHAGLPPEKYRDYLDPQHRDTFDMALPIQNEMLQRASQRFLGCRYQSRMAPWTRDRTQRCMGS